MLSTHIELATLTYTRGRGAIHHWELTTWMQDLVGSSGTVTTKVRQVLSSFSLPFPGIALIDPSTAPEEVTSLEIPPEIRLRFHAPIDIDAPEDNIPWIYIDVTADGIICVSLSNEWPTGCATRCSSAVNELESILQNAPVFMRQRYFWSIASKKPEH